MKFLYKINFLFYLLAGAFWFIYIAGKFSFGGCPECAERNKAMIDAVNVLLGWGGLGWFVIAVTTSVLKRKRRPQP